MMVKRLSAGRGFDANDAVTPSGKIIPSVNSPTYQERVRRPKWNVKVGPLMDAAEGGRLLRQRLPGWTAADHEYAARFYDKASREEKDEWGKLLDRTHLQTFGVARKFTDYKISGIGRDEYPEKAKGKLRALAHLSSAHGDAAAAHWRAAGKRARMNPARRHAKRPRKSERGFFPKRAYSRGGRRGAHQVVYRSIKTKRKKRRNPATHIKHGGSAFERSISGQRLRNYRGFRRAGGAGRAFPFKVQVQRGKKWITLGEFPFKASATDYGRALKARYPSKSFRVFW